MIHEIKNNQLHIKVNSAGAELQSLFSMQHNQEMLWQADPAHWARHAPILFPIVGRLAHDKLIKDGKPYPMTQHGFARDSEFVMLEKNNTTISLLLTNDESTEKQYPFAFTLKITYLIIENTLRCKIVVSNPADVQLPFSLGGHPAFNWPILPGIEKENHRIVFEKQEKESVSLLGQGLIISDDKPSPLVKNKLNLTDDLFSEDALIFKDTNSKSIRYESVNSDKKASIDLAFKDYDDLGVWTKAGANFICLEPWNGYSSPSDFDGEFTDKPGIIILAPGQSREFRFQLTVN